MTHALTEAWLARRAAIRSTRTRLGMEGYLHLAAMLRDLPMTAVQLTAASGMGHVAAYRFLSTLHQRRHVHVCGWNVKPKTPARPVFAWSAGVDVPPPATAASGRPCDGIRPLPRHRVPPMLLRFCDMLDCLGHCVSHSEIMAQTGIETSVVRRSLDVAVALGLAHVPLWQWRSQGGGPVPQYAIGPGVNAPKPAAFNVKRSTLKMRNERAKAARPFVPLADVVAQWGNAA